MSRVPNTVPRYAASLLLLVSASYAPDSYPGAYVFAGDAFGTDLVAHPNGWTTSTSGNLEVRVCITPGTPNAGVMATSVQNIVDRFNLGVTTVGNLRLGSDNDITPSEVDFESTAAHEVGHCLGLAHVNLATESGLSGADRNYTKSTTGSDGVFNLTIGSDGVRGSPDDDRGDDLNLHWFETGVNDPFSVSLEVDETNYSNDLSDLPSGDDYSANGDRSVAQLFGYPNTESVMQQGAGFDEDQRTLTADDIATLSFARTGRDRELGTNDDYQVTLVYGGQSSSSNCDITVAFDDAETGFAVCQTTASVQPNDYARFTSSSTFYNNGFNWAFSSRRIPYPAIDEAVVSRFGTVTTLIGGDESVLQNDIDQTASEDGLIVSTTLTVLPTQGNASINSDGTFSYTNTAGVAARDLFQYRVCVDDTSPAETTCAHQYVVVTVLDNEAPEAQSDSLTLAEGTSASELTGGSSSLIENDSDPDPGDVLSVTAEPTAGPESGSVVLNSNGTFSYAHDGSETLADSFVYEVCDQSGLCDDASVSITISEVNDIPDATDDQLAGLLEDAPPLVINSSVLLADDSPGPGESSQTLSLIEVSNPVGGTVQLDNEEITFQPAANFNGQAQFVYQVRDNGTTNAEPDPQFDTGTVSFFISEQNDPPAAMADTLDPAPEDTPVLLHALSALTSNDSSGPDNESNQILTVTAITNVVGGTATIQDGNVVFFPTQDFNGSASFLYTVFDNGRTAGSGDPLSDTALATLLISEQNDPPIPGNDELGDVNEDVGLIAIPAATVLLNDSPGPVDESGQVLEILNLSGSTNGTAQLEGDMINFTIEPDFFGIATFNYQVGDNGTTNGAADPLSSSATVSVNVIEANDPPVATDDRIGDQVAGATVIIDSADLLRNDLAGPDSERDQTLEIVAVTSGPGSSVELIGDAITFSINDTFTGETGFSYTVQDNGETAGSPDPLSGNASVAVTVVADNLLPLARADVLTVVRGASATQLNSLSMSLAANDEDPNGDSITVVELAVTQPIAGTVAIAPSGTFEYTHAGGPQPSDFFEYEVCEEARPTACDNARAVVLVVDEAFPTCTETSQIAVAGYEVAIPYQQAFPGTALDYEASGLPPSLSLDDQASLISGTPSIQDAANSPFIVSVTGTHAGGEQIVRSFVLVIQSEPDSLFYAGNEAFCGLE